MRGEFLLLEKNDNERMVFTLTPNMPSAGTGSYYTVCGANGSTYLIGAEAYISAGAGYDRFDSSYTKTTPNFSQGYNFVSIYEKVSSGGSWQPTGYERYHAVGTWDF